MVAKQLFRVFVCVAFLLWVWGDLAESKKLIVLLVDGVRWDYIDDPSLKGIHRIIDNGVKAKYVIPIFPSLSYPNWYTLVTGLYAENHGFISNSIYDNDTNSFFTMIPNPGATDPLWWNEAEPLWVTAEKLNKRAGLYWWGGCEVEIGGTHPTICERQLYDGPPTPEGRTDFLERIDDMMEMFKPSKRFPVDRLSLALMYYVSVDFVGHHSGVNTLNIKTAMRDIDYILDQMQNKIKNAGLQDEVNIMIVSDHGMTDTTSTTTKYIKLGKYASKIKYQLESGGVSMIIPQPGMLDELVKDLQTVKGLHVYKKEDIPVKYHLKNNKRTPPILLVAQKGFYILKVGGSNLEGHHGYDPELVDDMRTVFFATGPDFKKGFKADVLHITDLYNVMCAVLGISPLPNNGSWERTQVMLREQPTPEPTLDYHSDCSRNENLFLLTTLSAIFMLFVYFKYV